MLKKYVVVPSCYPGALLFGTGKKKPYSKHVFIYNLELLHLGPKPGIPRNLTVTEIDSGFLITWQPPLERADLIQHYAIKYRTDGGWKPLNKVQIRPEDTHFLGTIIILFTM